MVIQIALVLIALILGVNALFIFAIWRAILGKSEVTIKSGIAMNILAKSMDKLGNKLDHNSTTNDALKKEFKTFNTELKRGSDD